MSLRRHARVMGMGATVVAVTVAAVGIGLSSASSAETVTSETHAASHFLGGTLSEVPLGATAENNGLAQDVVNHRALLSAPANPLLRVGVANQVAQAGTQGVARALSGAVDDGDGIAPADLSLTLNSVVGGTPLQGVLEDLTLNLGALSSAAAVDAGREGAIAGTCTDMSQPVHCRGYRIAGGALTFTAPLVGDLVTQVIGTLTPVTDAVNGLAGPNGALAQALKGVSAITDVIPVADLDLVATVDLANLQTAVRSALQDPLTDDIVRIDLTTGEITADLDKLVTAATGKSLSKQDPNTEILSKAVIDELTSHLVTLLGRLPGQVLTVVEGLVDAARVDIGANVCVLSTGTAPDCEATPPIGPVPAIPGTGVAIDIGGTIAQLLSSQGTFSTILQLGPIRTPLPVGDLVGALLPALGTVTDAIDQDVTPALNGVVGTVTSGLTPALDALPALLSLTVNNQETSTLGGLTSYAQSALKVSVAGALDVEVARSEVSARLTSTADPDPTVDPDPSPDPDPDPDPSPDPDPVAEPDPADVPEPAGAPDPVTQPGPARPSPVVPTSVTSGV